MSKENDDIDAGLQRDLQPPAPTAPNGAALGPAAPDAPEPPPAATLANVGAPAPAPAAAAAQALGEPGTLPPTWCKKCQAIVKPEGKGRCPRCQTFLRLNFSRRTHPVNVLRRDAILAKLVADFTPRNTMQRAQCEQLAGILEQLESMKPGSPEHQRLVQLSQLLGSTLEEARLARGVRTPDNTPEQTTEGLIERTTAILRGLLDMRDAEQAPPPADTTTVEDTTHATTASEPATASAPPPSAKPEPACPYCHRTCIGPEHFAYAVLHHDDPEEIKRRDAEATAEMMFMLGKPSRW